MPLATSQREMNGSSATISPANILPEISITIAMWIPLVLIDSEDISVCGRARARINKHAVINLHMYGRYKNFCFQLFLDEKLSVLEKLIDVCFFLPFKDERGTKQATSLSLTESEKSTLFTK